MPVAITARPKQDIFEIADNVDTEWSLDESITYPKFLEREYQADQRLHNLMIQAQRAGLMPIWPH